MHLEGAPDVGRLHAVAYGYVQGVGFRYFVLHRARALGLCGWVRNPRDGGVECLAEGSRKQLERLLEEVRRGPRAADVPDVRVDWPAAPGARSPQIRVGH